MACKNLQKQVTQGLDIVIMGHVAGPGKLCDYNQAGKSELSGYRIRHHPPAEGEAES